MGNTVTVENTSNGAIDMIKELGTRWLQKHIGINYKSMVSNTLLLAKLLYQARVNSISKMARERMKNKIQEFIWGGKNKKRE